MTCQTCGYDKCKNPHHTPMSELQELQFDLEKFKKAWVQGTDYPYWLNILNKDGDDTWRTRFFRLADKVILLPDTSSKEESKI